RKSNSQHRRSAMWHTGNVTDFPFKNNVPDPLLSGSELPSFKFALEQSPGKVLGRSFGKEATVEELPISKGVAGVSMRLEPGVKAGAPLACYRRGMGLRP